MLPLPGRLATVVAGALVIASVTWSASALGETNIDTIAGAETATVGSNLATQNTIDEPGDVAALPGSGSTWHVYVADQDNCTVRRVALPAGTITTPLGQAGSCASIDRPTAAAGPWTLGVVTALGATSDGKLLIGEREGSVGRIQLYDPLGNAGAGSLVTVAGNGTCGTVPSTTSSTIAATTAALCNINGIGAHPSDVGRYLIVSRSSSFVSEVFQVTAGNLKRVASGSGACGGTALTACFSFARDALYAGGGNLFIVSDSGKGLITKYDSNNQGTAPLTIAGGGTDYPGDGGLATSAKLKGPIGLSLAYDDGYYIADYRFTGDADDGCRVRHASAFLASATIATAAGDGSCVSDDGSRIDDVPGTQTHVILPTGLELYPGGLLVSELFGTTHADATGATGNGRVRQLDRTTLLSRPPAVTNATQVSFTMAGLETGATFECTWDNPDATAFYSSCTSPFQLPAAPVLAMQEGQHGFHFNVTTLPQDPTPPVYSWKEDFTPPSDVVLTSPAAEATGLEPQPTFSWQPATDANGIERYELWIDGAKSVDAGTATQAKAPAPLSEGEHNWHVEAFDVAGNVHPSATRTFASGSAPTASFTVSPNPALVGRTVTFDGSGSSDANGPIARYEWDLDGDGSFETDGGGAATTSRSYDSVRTITVGLRVTDGVGLQTTTTRELKITDTQTAPPGQLGVTINNGAQYTRTPDVVVTATFPSSITSMLFSNDGGFIVPSTFPPQRETKWKLDSSGPERLPKIVYVRFLTGPFTSETHTDDIILDETPPKVDQASVAPVGGGASAAAAKARKWTVKVKASDSNSGVASLQVTANKRKPGKLIAYKRKLGIRSKTRPKFIRARDKAGNFSPWRTAKKR